MSSSLLELSSEVFTILNALIEERIGMHYGLADRELLAHKLSARAIEAGFDSLLDYYYYLRYDAASNAEFNALIDTLVVGETYFFREFDQLRAVIDDFVVPLARTGARPRIWSAACSTGEEPLTVAMLLDDRGILDRCQVLATDVSARSLERAKAGKFGSRALRSIPDQKLAKRYLKTVDQRVVASSDLLDRISFRRVNLIDSVAVSQLGVFDLIVCRNVFIYFRDATTERVVTQLADQLNPDGILLVGVSESLLRFAAPLDCEERGGAFYYRKVTRA